MGTQRNSVESNGENVNDVPSPQVSRSIRPILHVNDLLLSRDVPRESSNIYNLSRDSQTRTHNIDIRGISSIHPVESESNDRCIMPDHKSGSPYYPHEEINPPRTSTANRRDYPDSSSDDSRVPRRRGYSQEGRRPPERERYPSSDRRHPRRRGLPNNGRPPDKYGGRPPEDRGPSGNGGPPDNGGPLMMEDHQMTMEDPQDIPIEEDLQDLEDLLDQ